MGEKAYMILTRLPFQQILNVSVGQISRSKCGGDKTGSHTGKVQWGHCCPEDVGTDVCWPTFVPPPVCFPPDEYRKANAPCYHNFDCLSGWCSADEKAKDT